MLTIDDFHAYKKALLRDAKPLMKASTLSRPELHGAFQALDDWFEANRANLKAAIDSGAGTTVPNALAKKIGRAWMSRKWGGE